MAPPGEICVINRDGRTFRAYFTGLYNTLRHTYQYRVLIPNVELSLVVIEFTRRQLREYNRTDMPILIEPQQ